jgi:hypothetical protein
MRSFLISLVFVVLAAPALAVDGVLEINQTCALETGCFAGDSAGFPVEVIVSGSYRLTGNLIAPSTSTTMIVINSENVTVRGMGSRGIDFLTGQDIRVSDVRVISNGLRQQYAQRECRRHGCRDVAQSDQRQRLQRDDDLPVTRRALVIAVGRRARFFSVASSIVSVSSRDSPCYRLKE